MDTAPAGEGKVDEEDVDAATSSNGARRGVVPKDGAAMVVFVDAGVASSCEGEVNVGTTLSVCALATALVLGGMLCPLPPIEGGGV